MSCNQPYFKGLLGAVKETWAKPLIKNKYDNIIWFSYTSCDNKHPVPYVDFEEHMIYVDCEDDLHHTYEKTQKAYQMIKDLFDFDYVIRTNTTTFVNIDNLLRRVEQELPEDAVIGNWYGYMCPQNTNIRFNMLVGFFYGMKREFFEYGLSADNEYLKDESGNTIFENDDVIFSKRLMEKIGGNYHNPNGINSNKKLTMYKVCKHEDLDKFPEINIPNNFIFSFNPECVNDNVVIRIRSFYKGYDRIERGHEIEHMYELDSAMR